MGVDLNIYIGPYIEYRVEVVTVMENACSHNQNEPYCPTCGKKNELVASKEERPGIDLFEEPICERLHSTSFMSPPEIDECGYRAYKALPNIDWGGFGLHIDPYYEECIDLEDVDIEGEIMAFENYFKNDIDFLIKECGIENVEVSFGILSWCS